jgi:hypothetical protein
MPLFNAHGKFKLLLPNIIFYSVCYAICIALKIKGPEYRHFLSPGALALVALLFISFFLAFKNLMDTKASSTLLTSIHIAAIFITILFLSV